MGKCCGAKLFVLLNAANNTKSHKYLITVIYSRILIKTSLFAIVRFRSFSFHSFIRWSFFWCSLSFSKKKKIYFHIIYLIKFNFSPTRDTLFSRLLIAFWNEYFSKGYVVLVGMLAQIKGDISI